MKRTALGLALLLLLPPLFGCGGVTVQLGDGGGGPVISIGGGPTVGYYRVPDRRVEHWHYYFDGTRWYHWDEGRWRVDAGFVWRDDYSYDYWSYDPYWYADQYDPHWSPDDDPYYWDSYYYDDGYDPYYYGDGWYDPYYYYEDDGYGYYDYGEYEDDY